VNIPSTNHLKAADYAGTYSGKSEDKFKSLKLTPVKSEFVNAPCVREFPYALECRLAYTLNVGLHTMFIGEIVNITADEEILGKEGMPDIEKVRPLIYCTDSKSYYSVGKQVSKAFLSKKLG
jgi:flavin reductase (DIM6/NTAB) family NADH-FMN oxidoreductase RutF